jgi:putative ABC transport system ATP-binding protein
MRTPLLSASSLGRTYGAGDRSHRVLTDVDLDAGPGMTAVVGPSGSGKSTLLFCLAGLEHPTDGGVTLLGTDLARSRPGAIARLYRQQVGFVFQSYNLIPYLSALENAALPGMLGRRRGALRRAREALAELGLSAQADAPANRLSGGQQQRVALARVLAQEASVIFADEPTGALDSAASRAVMGKLRARADAGAAVVLVTHELEYAALADRVLVLRDGRVHARRSTVSVRELATLMDETAPEGGPDQP